MLGSRLLGYHGTCALGLARYVSTPLREEIDVVVQDFLVIFPLWIGHKGIAEEERAITIEEVPMPRKPSRAIRRLARRPFLRRRTPTRIHPSTSQQEQSNHKNSVLQTHQ